ncbi:hypothetical protein [Streptomyces sp. NPDC093598]|uniref:hypothetical protein n=1 Tax=Streptomyces sp. NPDC093598 TaxID=3366046 RepID=UPI003830B007
MGADLTSAAAARGYAGLCAAIEVTRTGITRLRGVGLRPVVVDLDRVPLKNNVHNRHAVGISTWQAFMSRTDLTLHGSVVVVVGHGEVGSGLARAATSLGTIVLVAEASAERRLIAAYDRARRTRHRHRGAAPHHQPPPLRRRDPARLRRPPRQPRGA